MKKQPLLANGERGVLPQARTTDLVIQDLPDEELVYDLRSHRAYCLNQTAALVWKECNGTLTVREIAATLSQNLKTEVHEHLIILALSQLDKADLLQAESWQPETTLSRRTVLHRMGKAVMLAPLVITVIAPTAKAGLTCVGLDCSPSGINGVDCPCTRCCGRKGSPTSGVPRVCQLFRDLAPGSPCNADCMCQSNDCISAPPLTPASWTCA